jgi:hypothetical protein
MVRTLFSHKRYFQAMHGYEHPGMPREIAIAYAYYLLEKAHAMDNERRSAHAKVAKSFLASARETTILCERNEYYHIAAEAFVVLEDHAHAAQAFEKASKFMEAA